MTREVWPGWREKIEVGEYCYRNKDDETVTVSSVIIQL